ncbi:glycoside hydrolase family 78 protein [Olivibacter sp. XZL3]|uniref:glycoside hydrolase family 78 protein n=1 Tax=Olivibacter sp. XZL3 TaxID=1735116 RepID=UPI001067029A|nr:glycoside hydrolase family 78 protein [Olivibacter sp. XZL3]
MMLKTKSRSLWRYPYLFLLFAFFSVKMSRAQEITLYGLTCEYQENPIGIDDPVPRFSWKMKAKGKDVMQTAYELKVATNEQDLKKGSVWHSGKVASEASVLIPFGADELQSRTRYFWQVRVWDNRGNVSPWSAVNFWETGLLNPTDWKAKWIQLDQKTPLGSNPSPQFRKAFNLKQGVKKARLYITAHGLYEAYLNGEKVGNAYFTPGWTSYHKRLQYQVYDVSEQLKKGQNVMGVMLGDGWFKGNLMGGNNYYGRDLALLAQLEIELENGEKIDMLSDGTWRSSTDGPIRMADNYNGETYDARMEQAGWATAAFNDATWKSVKVNDSLAYQQLVTSPAPLVTAQETIKPVKMITTPKGEKVIDFGQNLVGWIQFDAAGNPGDSLVFYHAEVLDKEGNFYTENLRSAKQMLTYIFKGTGLETYHPRFSFQGFRYVKVEGAKEEVNLNNIKAIVLHSAMRRTGDFTTSDSLINQLQHNILWGQKGNFLDVPTDCPQRDERLGWTGDAQAFFNTAAYNMDVAGFFMKWLQDVKADQFASGAIPHVVPYYWKTEEGGSAGWSDVATIIPWNFYRLYGDKRILEQQYTSMAKWVQFMVDNSTNDLWNKGFHFGDWLFYIPNDDRDGRAAITDKYLIAQCFFGHSVQLMINAAEVLSKKEDVARYQQLLGQVKTAFVKEYVTPSGRLVSNSQTAYVLALQFDMLPENLCTQAAKRLADNIKSYDNHLTTGFLGTPYLCHVLSRYGYEELAYTLLMQRTYPSWLYPVLKGATTIWERWDGIKADGSFQNKDMNSFNHYAYGAIGDWMYQQIAGIQAPSETPGYKEFVIAPRPGGGLSFANASLETIYGKIVSNWKITGNEMQMMVEVPPNTTAKVLFPNAVENSVKDEKGNVMDNSAVEIGSGKYSFTFALKAE